MSKTLSKSKNKKIVGGNKFNFDNIDVNRDNNRISIIANEINGNKTVTLIFYEKKNTQLNIFEDDIKDNINLKIITSNMTDAKYYEPNINVDNGKLNKKNIVKDMNNFDTCIIVEFNNICYIFLYVHTSGNNAIKNFNDNSNTNNLKVLNALMIANFKELGLNINFVNKFIAGVKGYIDGQKNEIKKIIEKKAAVKIQAVARGVAVRQRLKNIENGGGVNNSNKLSKKINTNKILNNLILKLSKIHNVKKPTKPKTKVTKPTKPKATKPTKPKVTKPKATKKI